MYSGTGGLRILDKGGLQSPRKRVRAEGGKVFPSGFPGRVKNKKVLMMMVDNSSIFASIENQGGIWSETLFRTAPLT